MIIACTLFLFVACGTKQESGSGKKVLIHELEDRGGIAYLPKADNPYTGSVYAYFPDGKTIYLKSDFVDGKQHGEYVEYLQDGKISFKRSYDSGIEHGEWIEYYEDGSIRKKENYKNGQLDGEWITYFNNGQMRVKGQFELGEEVGEWFQWDEEGNPMER